MSDKTGISWTDTTWNCVRGCTRVSEGCRHCYAETMAARIVRMGKGKPTPYDGLVRMVGDEARWTGEVSFDAETLAAPLSWRRPRRIFVNSMSDLFHEKLTNEQIAAVFGVMAACHQHTFQVLTKRSTRMREWFAWARDNRHDFDEMTFAALGDEGYDYGDCAMFVPEPWPLPNVWLGVSVENQDAADQRVPDLNATPAAVRYLSCEPLLGDVRLDDGFAGWLTCPGPRTTDDEAECCESRHVNGFCFHGIDWLIAGCESGPGARPCDVAWLRSLRNQCADAAVPFFLKQSVAPRPNQLGFDAVCEGPGSKRKAGGVIELPYLDGVQHAAFPGGRS